MTTKRSTKRALLLSLLSLVTCLTMLVGSTFAWFTDSVTSAGNKIQAGTLDIDLVDAAGESLEGQMIEWVLPEGDTRTQDKILWEPGCTYETETFKIVNKGNLDLKFKFEVTGIKGDAKLLEVIDFTCAGFNYSDEEFLGAGDETTYFTLKGHMDEEAGNEYQGLKIEGIAITVLATQVTSEYDSINNVYDKDASYPDVSVVSNEADLVAALEAGKDVTLITDIATTATEIAPYGNKVGFVHNGGVFNGGGNTIGIDNSGDNYTVMTKGGTITNLNIDNGFRGIVIMYAAEDIIIDNVNVGGEGVCYPLNTAEYGDPNAKLVVTNSTLAGWTSFAGIKSASFTNVNFEQGQYYTNVYGRLVKPYVETVFENCDFSDEYYIDLSALSADAKVTLKNCTVNGVALTASNWTSLIVPESECGAGQISIEARNGSYMSASNVLDYVIIQ